MKKHPFLMTWAILAVAICTNSVEMQAQPTIPKNLQKAIQPNRLPEGVIIPPNLLLRDIDLAAQSINFTILKVLTQFRANVKIEGVVRNVGRLNYASGANQQTALLYEDNGGAYRLVASRTFQNLAPNATVKVSFSRLWDKSSPAEGEFPPNYILIIGTDPDIYIDGNNNNDDSNSANNRLTKSSSEINTMTFKR